MLQYSSVQHVGLDDLPFALGSHCSSFSRHLPLCQRNSTFMAFDLNKHTANYFINFVGYFDIIIPYLAYMVYCQVLYTFCS